MLHAGRFSTGGQGGQLHTPRTHRQPPAREIPERRNKSEAAPTYPTRGNVGFFLKIERKTKQNKKKKNKNKKKGNVGCFCWFLFFFSEAQLTPKPPAEPRDGELAGKSGLKSIPSPRTLRLSANCTPGGTENFFLPLC